MPSVPQSFAADSPWWKGAEWIHQDADLGRLAAAPLRFEHPIPFDLGVDAVYTLRGPRQVGKSTLLKRIIEALLLRQGVPPRCILYADIEGAGITTIVRLRNAINSYVAWVRTSYPDQRIYLFLDEITGVTNWGVTIRTLFRQGALTNATVVATGSHALDLARGGETAPGRRGEHHVDHPDWIMMPLAFRDYVAAHAPELVAALPAID
ncbi:MAG TPA: AAA family ATPase, partial [Gemmatimonadaceae bacterium]|nr:AAA family ATPase [Gemmatimonadaceae bacterium]